MSRLLRIGFVLVGLAATVYGAASLTGGWLGEPPWWTTHAPPSRDAFEGTGLNYDAVSHFMDFSGPRRGRAWISLGVVAVGLTFVAVGLFPSRPLRIALCVLGIVLLVYGVASLTGGWLGEPSWWKTLVPAPRDEAHGLRGDPLTHFVDYDLRYEPRPDRVWISVGVIAAGLGMVAVGALPRRGAAATNSAQR